MQGGQTAAAGESLPHRDLLREEPRCRDGIGSAVHRREVQGYAKWESDKAMPEHERIEKYLYGASDRYFQEHLKP